MSMDMYRAQIMDHYKNPRNKGRFEHPDLSNDCDNPLCGDEVRMELKVGDGAIVEGVRFDGKGCAISLASASILTNHAEGMSLEELKAMDRDDMLEIIGIQPNPTRIKCALLAMKCIQSAIYRSEEGEGDGEE